VDCKNKVRFGFCCAIFDQLTDMQLTDMRQRWLC
jgi:hypothetical protein